MKNHYQVIGKHNSNPGTLTYCLHFIAAMVGDTKLLSRVTVKQAIESGYSIIKI